jgi:cation diffusion facilitator family transporter
MEHIAPLIMAIFLFVTGIQIGESSVHQALEPHEVHYWNALPWILLATIIVKQWLAGFVRLLGKRVNSHAIMTNAAHHTIEAVISLAVIAGLVAGHYFNHPEVDGYIGILVSAWLFFLAFTHGRDAIVPLLGDAPSRELLQKIRDTARATEGVEDVHEIIVHNYGSLYMISLHVEIPEKYGSAEMHEITENCELRLRKKFGGAVVCHTDPLIEKTPELMAIEEQFKKTLKDFPQVVDYHDFRIVAASPEKIVLVADIDVREDVPESEFEEIAEDLEKKAMEKVPNIEYCQFYITPKYAY